MYGNYTHCNGGNGEFNKVLQGFVMFLRCPFFFVHLRFFIFISHLCTEFDYTKNNIAKPEST